MGGSCLAIGCVRGEVRRRSTHACVERVLSVHSPCRAAEAEAVLLDRLSRLGPFELVSMRDRAVCEGTNCWKSGNPCCPSHSQWAIISDTSVIICLTSNGIRELYTMKSEFIRPTCRGSGVTRTGCLKTQPFSPEKSILFCSHSGSGFFNPLHCTPLPVPRVLASPPLQTTAHAEFEPPPS